MAKGSATTPSDEDHLQPQLPILSRLYNGTTITTVQSVLTPLSYLQSWHAYFYPPAIQPSIVKAYDVRPHLPVRIFFPSSYDQTSPLTLPTLFTIHGGGFCLGTAADDDVWNAQFASSHATLVIALEVTLPHRRGS